MKINLLIQKGDSYVFQNSEINKVAVRKNTPESKVIIVDQYTGFDAEKDTFDGYHPNKEGEEKMAQRWFEAVENFLNKRNSKKHLNS